MDTAVLQVDVLGPLVIRHDGVEQKLPQSKKTRGLLAYLALIPRVHPRERLCALLWDVADDPRAALRWSLSKVRPLVNTGTATRLLADRSSVQLKLDTDSVDWLRVQHYAGRDLSALGTDQLSELLGCFRGEFLEGLELSDFHDYTAWAAAQRERARKMHSDILAALVEQLSEDPEAAAVHARERCRIDPLNEVARANLVSLLGRMGNRAEAEAQFNSGKRLIEELGGEVSRTLVDALHAVPQARGSDHAPAALHVSHGSASTVSDAAPAAQEPRDAADATPDVPAAPMDAIIGREAECERLVGLIDRVAKDKRTRVMLLSGEPGVGKTRLLDELECEARRRGGLLLRGASFEAETGRPYGPLVEALRQIPSSMITDEMAASLSPLLPELRTKEDAPPSRERLFGAFVDLISTRTHEEAPALIIVDDLHWSDEATSELLHYVTRMCRHRPVAIVLGARDGELVDCEPAMRLVRSVRRDGILEELALGPLDSAQTAQLVLGISGSEEDAGRVFEMSGGNPLLARELARFGGVSSGDVPSALRELIADRLARLSVEAADVLRWGAVLGPVFEVSRLSVLSRLDTEVMMGVLEQLERHALIRAKRGAGSDYAFPHELVRQVVYAEVSEPRRRLMHLQVAKSLAERDDPDGTSAVELAHHAHLAGEAAMAARACAAAGKACLRVFASAEAFAHARRGFHYLEALPERERIPLEVSLTQVRLSARRPEDVEAQAEALERLAERALDAGFPDHASVTFQMVSTLRWEEGAFRDAERLMARAQVATHGGGDALKARGIVEAARCLVLLEKDLSRAEAMLAEAGHTASPSGTAPFALSDAEGLLRLHRGDLAGASEKFEQARSVARLAGDRISEFYALEHQIMSELYRGNFAIARAHSEALLRLGDRLREGSEGPFARALHALCLYVSGEVDAPDDLDEALVALRHADAKQRLAFVLLRAAEKEFGAGRIASAQARASEALEYAETLNRPSDVAVARCVLLSCARATGETPQLEAHEESLMQLSGYSVIAAEAIRGVLDGAADEPSLTDDASSDAPA